MIKKTFFLILLFFFLIGSGAVVSKELEVYTLTNKERKGDANAVMGIKDALLNQWQGTIQNIDKDFDVQNTSNLLTALSTPADNHTQRVLLTVGEEGGKFLKELEEVKDLITCHTSHMLTQMHPELINHCHYIILLKHAVTEEFEQAISQSQSTLITTIGVAHKRKKENAESAYQAFIPELPKAKSYIAVMLGGDAPDEKGKYRLFTAHFAEELAHYIIKEAHNRQAHVFILNGPRTGSRSPLNPNKIIPTAHKDGKPDHVTQTFVKVLQSKIKAGITLYDFQQGAPSQMDKVLGVIQLAGDNTVFFVPGESTSTVSETIDVIGPAKVVAYWNTAMNDMHQAHIDSEYQAGRVSYLNEFFDFNPPLKSAFAQKLSASEQIARTLVNNLSPLSKNKSSSKNE